MRSYTLYQNRVDIVKNDGQLLRIFLDENSGNGYFRPKLNTVTHVRHTGMYLGYDVYGNRYFMHNHFEIGRPGIVTEKMFSKDQKYFQYKKVGSEKSLTVINKGLKEIVRGEQYDSVSYNCQTFVNLSFGEERKSEDVQRIGGNLFWGTVIIVGLVALAKA